MNQKKGTIIAIIRDVEPSEIIAIQEALLEGGIHWIEVSLSNEVKGLECLKRLHDHFGEQIHLGVGTVSTIDQAKKAMDAGAAYIITPGWDKELINALKELNVEIYPGVFTPGEILQALNLGIKVVKLFPASNLGPSYIKNLQGPFPTINVMGVGGISLENIQEYYNAGCSSFGIGSDLVPRGATKADIQQIKSQAQKYVSIVNG